jgi:hypothetical protein
MTTSGFCETAMAWPMTNILSLYFLRVVSICLDRESLSRQFEKGHLDSRDFLDSLKKDISTVEIFSTV